MMRALLLPHAGACAFTIAFALTLALAAWLTPRHWWRRPTLRGGAVLAGGTLAFGVLFMALFMALAGKPQRALAAVTALAAGSPAAESPAAESPADTAPQAGAAQASPASGTSYRVAEALNLRAARGVHAPRLAVLPAGSRVVASGVSDGDWWQVRARVDGRELAGWTSSLWLRRGDEAVPHRSGGR